MPPPWAACSTRSTMPTPASPEPGRYRGALIGAGGIARQSHLPALRSAPLRGRVDVVAVVDTAPAVPPVDGIPLLRDRAALSDLAPLDFIDICTPTASHLELIMRSEEHTSELQSHSDLVCRLLLEKKNKR